MGREMRAMVTEDRGVRKNEKTHWGGGGGLKLCLSEGDARVVSRNGWLLQSLRPDCASDCPSNSRRCSGVVVCMSVSGALLLSLTGNTQVGRKMDVRCELAAPTHSIISTKLPFVYDRASEPG